MKLGLFLVIAGGDSLVSLESDESGSITAR